MLVVISGGRGAGKTTVLAELERRGLRCAAEVARLIIQEQVRNSGDALPVDAGAIDRFVPGACAGGFHDVLRSGNSGYALLCAAGGLPFEDEILEACRKYRNSRRVFLAPPWQEIYATDEERKQPYDEAVRTYELMSRPMRLWV